jgi:general secretion pathway protein M
MKNPFSNSRSALTVAVTLALILAPLVAGGVYVAQRHRLAQDQLQQLEPRYARLLGLQASQEDLQKAQAQAEALLARHAYAADQDVSQAGNDAQQRIRQTFSQAGMTVTSSQVLAPTQEKQFERIPLAVRAEGDLLALQSALMVLSSQTPTVLINDLSIQLVGSGRTGDPSQRLVLQMRLAVLRMRA